MSVLIKGMKKPKNCIWRDGKCPLLGDDDDCKLQDCQEEWTWQDQYKGCPLSDAPGTNVGDIVSRQDAIEAIEEITWYHQNRNNEMVMGANSSEHQAWYKAEDVYEALEKLPSAQPEQRWIPISERLPEYGVSVLTYDGYCFFVEKRIPIIRDCNGEAISGDWWVSDDYDENESEYYPNLRDGACIAWMPLPGPYKGGE